MKILCCNSEHPRFHHRVLISTVILQGICVMLDRILIITSNEKLDKSAIWFLVCGLMSVGFCLYFSWDGCRTGNVVELVGFLISSFVLATRLGFEFFWKSTTFKDRGNSLFLASFLLQISFNIFHWIYFPRILKEFRWHKYKRAGATQKGRTLDNEYSIFKTTKLIDLQNTTVMIFTGFVFFSDNDWAFYPVIALMCSEFVWVYLGSAGPKTESKKIFMSFFIVSPCLPIFVGFVAVSFILGSEYFADLATGYEVMYAICTMALISRTATIWAGIRLWPALGTGNLKRIATASLAPNPDTKTTNARGRTKSGNIDNKNSISQTVAKLNPLNALPAVTHTAEMVSSTVSSMVHHKKQLPVDESLGYNINNVV
eukprot:TRINITY_DN775902_c0_g1_i1.p1 TRINITY_DN775902_c0_g1~~TRINITY_DN775902_c0_g1_i1.p1  ORF type:complete len:371 (-),score=61.77 TRINITY_DN775902_c0_g1_i1:328-1440(-)